MYLVFDVGATFVKYAWMTAEGVIEEKGKTTTANKATDGVEEFVASIGVIYDMYKDRGNIEGIAMGLPGQIDVENGIVYGGGGLKYLDKISLGDILSQRCDDVRVSLENDGKCAALAEVWLGNAKDVQDACVLVFGTGLGGGIIKDRRAHRGNRLVAGELSFAVGEMTREDLEQFYDIDKLTVTETFRNMPYLETSKCSTSGLVYHVATAKGLPLEEVDGEKIYRWAAEGDEVCIDILEEMYFNIAKICLNLYVSFDPDVILIGGGISAEPRFFEGIQKYVKRLKMMSMVYDGLKLDVCKFRNDSNLLGALYNFKQKYTNI